MEKKREILKTIKIRKLEYVGPVFKGTRYKLLRFIIQAKIIVKRSSYEEKICLRAIFRITLAPLLRFKLNQFSYLYSRIILPIYILQQDVCGAPLHFSTKRN